MVPGPNTTTLRGRMSTSATTSPVRQRCAIFERLVARSAILELGWRADCCGWAVRPISRADDGLQFTMITARWHAGEGD